MPIQGFGLQEVQVTYFFVQKYDKRLICKSLSISVNGSRVELFEKIYHTGVRKSL